MIKYRLKLFNSIEIDFIIFHLFSFRMDPNQTLRLPLNDITAYYETANDGLIASENLSFGLMTGNEYKFDNEIAILVNIRRKALPS